MLLLSKLLYNLSIQVYGGIIRFAVLFNTKAAKWVSGRKNWHQLLKPLTGKENIIWVHCASLGEFEQARPLIEQINKEYTDHKILLTFFSPSGYEIRKDYEIADFVRYLPLDTPQNARRFVQMVKPALVIFTKYDFWLNYLFELRKQEVPTILISAIFRPGQVFFQWYGKLFKKALSGFTKIYVQDKASFELLRKHGFQNVQIAGDTRIDRVVQISQRKIHLELVEQFKGNQMLIVAGSTHETEENYLLNYFKERQPDAKLIIAPHDIDEHRMYKIEASFPAGFVVRYSEGDQPKVAHAGILIIDSIGLLSSLYHYGDFAIIGGGFATSVHNLLEPMVFMLPVIYGPKYHKFKEACELAEQHREVTFNSYEQFADRMDMLIENLTKRKELAQTSEAFITANKGGTEKVMQGVKAHLHQIKGIVGN